MTWTKLGDEFSDEARDLSDAAFRLHVEGLLWSNRRLLDLRIPKRDVRRFAETDDPDLAAKELVENGWWLDDGDAWDLTSRFPEWQRDAAQVQQKRARDAERQRRFRLHRLGDHSLCQPEAECTSRRDVDRDSRRDVARDSRRDPGRGGSGRGTSSPSRPARPKNTSSPGADAPEEESGQDAPGQRDDVEQLCSRLVERMVANGCKPPTITKRWRQQARLLLDRDGRDLTKALDLLDWSQSDPFWSTNVHSLPTFREKYDQLQMKARDDWHRQQRRAPLPPDPATTGKRRLSM